MQDQASLASFGTNFMDNRAATRPDQEMVKVRAVVFDTLTWNPLFKSARHVLGSLPLAIRGRGHLAPGYQGVLEVRVVLGW